MTVKRYLVALDDGHGMQTSGKRTPIFPAGHKYAGKFMHENEFNREVVKLAGQYLVNSGFDVLYTAPTDNDTPLQTRTDLANNKIKNSFNRPADAFISVHANALNSVWGSQNGIETFWMKRTDEALGKIIHRHLMKGTKFTDRGLKVGNLHVLRETSMPAALVECGFMDNLREAELLMDGAYRKECAIEIAQAVCEYFKVAFVEVKEADKVMKPAIKKERVYATGGVLKDVTGNYKVKATDVRHLKLDKGTFELKLVWTKGRKVSELVKEYKADYGFNFPYFYNGNPVADLKIGDKVVYNINSGKTVNWNGIKYKNGVVTVGKIDVKENLGANGFAFKSSPLLIDNGNLCYAWSAKQDETASDITNGSAQRTVLGLDAQGNVHLAFCDGRTSDDKGFTLEEAALYMKSKGCVTALNGDGGGSTIIADQSGGLNQSLNTGKNERVVNHAVLIFIKDTKPTEPQKPIDKEEGKVKSLSKYFDDVFIDYQASSIDFAKEKGWISGVSATRFDPTKPLTRGDFTVILSRFYNTLKAENK